MVKRQYPKLLDIRDKLILARARMQERIARELDISAMELRDRLHSPEDTDRLLDEVMGRGK
jgi:hypothetical protein